MDNIVTNLSAKFDKSLTIGGELESKNLSTNNNNKNDVRGAWRPVSRSKIIIIIIIFFLYPR